MKTVEQKKAHAKYMRAYYKKKRSDPEWREKYREQRRKQYESQKNDETYRKQRREAFQRWSKSPQAAEWRRAYSRRPDVRERQRSLAAERRKDPEYRRRLNERNAKHKRTPHALAKSRERLRRYRKTESGRRSILNSVLKKHYGITLADFERLLSNQGGVCAICKKARVSKTHPRLNVDHCHKTGRVRGLLCWMCNRGIGLLGDDRSIILAAAEYLRR